MPKDGHFKAIPIYPDPKKRPSLRLDSNIIARFRQQGPFHQTRMNAVLRAYMRYAGQTSQPKEPVRKKVQGAAPHPARGRAPGPRIQLPSTCVRLTSLHPSYTGGAGGGRPNQTILTPDPTTRAKQKRPA